MLIFAVARLRLAGLSCLLLAPMALAQDGLRPEYFIRQQPNEAAFLRLDGFEADFTSTVRDGSGEVLLVSGIPGERLAPLFQYLPPTTAGRELIIEVNTRAATSRSRFDIGHSRLLIRDERSNRLAAAYRMLSQGQFADETNSAAQGSVRVGNLLDCAELFAEFGMEELHLWCRYLAAYLVLHRLGDAGAALDEAQSLLQVSGRHPDVRLGALALQAGALRALRSAGALPGQAGDDPLQSALGELGATARSQGADWQLAQAQFDSGLDLAARGDGEGALAAYREALDRADRIGAADLGTAVREAMVLVLGERGDAAATSEVLQEIGSQLAASGSADEVAGNLLAQARLYLRIFRPERAIPVLLQALALESNSLARSQMHLELARAWLATGQLDEAMAQARSAVVEPASGAWKRPSTLLDVPAGIGLIADIHRIRGEHTRAAEARAAQVAAGRTAAVYWSAGLDALAANDRVPAARLFQAVMDDVSADPDLRRLATLQRCVAGNESSACSPQSLASAYQALLSSGLPRLAAEARRAWSLLPKAQGGGLAACELVDEIRYLQAGAPGVLGDWFVEHGVSVAQACLQAALAQGAAPGLLALAKARDMQAQPAGVRTGAGGLDDNVRELLARRQEARDESATALSRDIAPHLARGRAAFEAGQGHLTRTGLDAALASLQDGEGVVAFFITGDRAKALLSRRSVVQAFDLGASGMMLEMLAAARGQWAVLEGRGFDAQAERLGARLLGPLAGALPRRVAWLHSGPTLGLPLDALRLDGRHLVEQHEVQHLQAFPAPPRNPTANGQGTFLAGLPEDYSGEYPLQLATPPELATVIAQFVGPGLHMVRGGALLADEFSDPRYAGADLLHLAMPAVIDLGQPADSWLELSEPGRGQGRQRFSAADVRARSVAARLAWMGAAQASGEPPAIFSGRIGLVSDYLDAGAQAVIATAWRPAPASAVAMASAFYPLWKDGASAADALARAKRSMILQQDPDGNRDWAAWQLYTR